MKIFPILPSWSYIDLFRSTYWVEWFLYLYGYKMQKSRKDFFCMTIVFCTNHSIYINKQHQGIAIGLYNTFLYKNIIEILRRHIFAYYH